MFVDIVIHRGAEEPAAEVLSLARELAGHIQRNTSTLSAGVKEPRPKYEHKNRSFQPLIGLCFVLYLAGPIFSHLVREHGLVQMLMGSDGTVRNAGLLFAPRISSSSLVGVPSDAIGSVGSNSNWPVMIFLVGLCVFSTCLLKAWRPQSLHRYSSVSPGQGADESLMLAHDSDMVANGDARCSPYMYDDTVSGMITGTDICFESSDTNVTILVAEAPNAATPKRPPDDILSGASNKADVSQQPQIAAQTSVSMRMPIPCLPPPCSTEPLSFPLEQSSTRKPTLPSNVAGLSSAEMPIEYVRDSSASTSAFKQKLLEEAAARVSSSKVPVTHLPSVA